jgi:hypothetical protein
MSAVEWMKACQALGLELRRPTAWLVPDGSFRRAKRSLGFAAPLAGGEDAFRHWMYGTRDGVEVVVAADWSAPIVHAVARVTPELGVGAIATTTGPNVPQDVPRDARDPAGLAELWSRVDGAAIERAIRACATLVVADGAVDVQGSPYTFPVTLKEQVDAAVALARALGEARRVLGPSAEQRAVGAAWAPAAEAAGLRFDAAKVEAQGLLRGCDFRLTLESDPREAAAVLTASFPQVLGWGLLVTRGPADPLASLFGGLSTSLGDPAFDALMRVQSTDVTPRNRLALDLPMRSALCDLALRSSELVVDDARLYVRFASAMAGPNEAAWLLGAAQHVVFHLAGIHPAPPSAPYR